MYRFIVRSIVCALMGVIALATAPSGSAQTSAEQEIVEKARLAVDSIRRDNDFPAFAQLLRRAKGVLIFPSLVKAGFIVGGEGGSGVLLTRDANGNWSYPAFYTLGSGSIGLQIGVQDAEVAFVIMTDKGLEQILKNEFKMGADASLAVGPIGAGVAAGTTLAFGADMYSFAKARGLFGGVSFDGTVIHPRNDYNRKYYGQNATGREIVMAHKVSNHAADALRKSLESQ